MNKFKKNDILAISKPIWPQIGKQFSLSDIQLTNLEYFGCWTRQHISDFATLPMLIISITTYCELLKTETIFGWKLFRNRCKWYGRVCVCVCVCGKKTSVMSRITNIMTKMTNNKIKTSRVSKAEKCVCYRIDYINKPKSAKMNIILSSPRKCIIQRYSPIWMLSLLSYLYVLLKD